MEKHEILLSVCESLLEEKIDVSTGILESNYQFIRFEQSKRKNFSYKERLEIYARDKFTDRYFNKKLIHPAVLKIISLKLPKAFPYHNNWKMGESHMAYWELYPTIDHIVPFAKSGDNGIENLVTVSNITNQAKMNSGLKELNWKLYEISEIDEWDGLTSWFVKYMNCNPQMLDVEYLQNELADYYDKKTIKYLENDIDKWYKVCNK